MKTLNQNQNNVPPTTVPYSHGDYQRFLRKFQRGFLAKIAASSDKLFTVAADESKLWTLYIDNVPSELRQHYNCACCRRFIQTYGNLVVIGDDGKTTSALWDTANIPEHMRASFAALKRMIEKSRITGVFISDDKVLGIESAGGWNHLHVLLPEPILNTNKLFEASQIRATKRENFRLVLNAIFNINPKTLDTAVTLLSSALLLNNEKILERAKWLQLLQMKHTHTNKSNNVVWREVALAPDGFCHPQSGMLGELIDDIDAHLTLDTITRKFASKMSADVYQRPQAPASDGNIKRAEDIVKKMNLESSLVRRFARLEDLQTVWMPTPVKNSNNATGVFAHLRKDAQQSNLSSSNVTRLTWMKFKRTALTEAATIEIYLADHAQFTALVTAQHYDAPPIILWDTEKRRNPVSWYVYASNSVKQVMTTNWSLLPRTWNKVTAIVNQPTMWNDMHYAQFNESVNFIIANCVDQNNVGCSLFPEILIPELHEVRSTIEAHSNTTPLLGQAEATACGVRLADNVGDKNIQLRVITKQGITLHYELTSYD